MKGRGSIAETKDAGRLPKWFKYNRREREIMTY